METSGSARTFVTFVSMLFLNLVQVSGRCPAPDWLAFEGYCYYISTDTLQFHPADSACQSMGTNLTSVHSPAENEFLIDQIRANNLTNLWIGLHDLSLEGHFEWTDGTPFDFSDWTHHASGHSQPDDWGDSEDCAHYWTRTDLNPVFGSWNDGPCRYHAKNYACKIKVVPPNITYCPDDIVTKADSGDSTANVTWNNPIASGLSGPPSVSRSHDPGQQFPIGETTVVYNITDTFDNSSTSCIFSVYVNDTTSPAISGCPSDIRKTTELGTSGVLVNWIEPTAYDYSAIRRSRSHKPRTQFPIGSTQVAYIFTDSFGNSALCFFTVLVEVVDTIAPDVTSCPGDIDTITELGSTGVIVFWDEPSATDLSGSPIVFRSHDPGTEFPIGVSSVTYTFTDMSNNTANCTFTITVNTVDSTHPIVTRCPDSFDTVAGRHVTWQEPIAFDISGDLNQTSSHRPGMFLIAPTNVVYTFRDSSNNSAQCNFTINVIEDTLPPAVKDCPSDITALHELGESPPVVSWTKPSSSDDQGRVTLIDFTHSSGQAFSDGSTLVVYTFADDSFNLAFCNFSVFVETVDTTPPTVQSCPTDIIRQMELGTPSIAVHWRSPLATDVSGNVTSVAQTHHPGDKFKAGSHNVCYTFADDAGNEATCAFIVTVQEVDTQPPNIINCPLDRITTAKPYSSSNEITWTEPTAIDFSNDVTLLIRTHHPGQKFYSGATNVMYVFVDSSNNLAVCNFSVIVKENTVNENRLPPHSEYQSATVGEEPIEDRSLTIAMAAMVIAVITLLLVLLVMVTTFVYIRKTKPTDDIQMKCLTKHDQCEANTNI